MRSAFRAVSAACLASALLGGCGPRTDDPANIPLRGHWQQETKLVALVVNDVWVDRSEVPIPLPKDQVIDKRCFEPKLRTADEFNDSFGNKLKNCSFGDLKREGGNITSEGTCSSKEGFDGITSGKMELEVHEKADKIDSRLGFQLFVKGRSGASERVRFGVTSNWKRLGDCV